MPTGSYWAVADLEGIAGQKSQAAAAMAYANGAECLGDGCHDRARVQMPVWVVHSDGERLFPLEMPRRIVKACGPRAELIVVEGLAQQ